MKRMRVVAPFVFFAVLIGISAVALRSAPPAAGGQLIVCGWDELYNFDLNQSPPKKVWGWRAEDRPEVPDTIRTKFMTIDGCKPVDGGLRIRHYSFVRSRRGYRAHHGEGDRLRLCRKCALD